MFVFYVDGKKFTTDNYNKILWDDFSSPDENTPAFENILKGLKVWCLKGFIHHRLTGPSEILGDGTYWFWLDNKFYGKNCHDWLKEHPNQTNAFQIEMLLKYT